MSFISKLFRKRPDKTPACCAIIAAAGNSVRMAGGDKLYTDINGYTVLAHTLSVFQKCNSIKEIIIVAREDRIEQVSEICAGSGVDKANKIIVGGSTRLESVLNGVMAVSKGMHLVAIHDGARPCVSPDIIERTVAAAAKHHAAAPAVKASSTVKRVKDGMVTATVDREQLYEIQTPQVFRTDIIKSALTNAYNKRVEITDDCMAAELIGIPVYVTEGSRNNIKITTREDIIIAEAILRSGEGKQ